MATKSKAPAAITALLALGAAAGALEAARAAPDVPPLPARLSDTGLFTEGSGTVVRPGILAFSPQYPLWSDGAHKRRWIALPPGTSIDAERPDAWEFPVGTRLWKEFSLGRPVETRYIERLADGSWRYAAYVWNDAGTDALLAPPQGIPALPLGNTEARTYAIPSESDCRACHEGAAVPVLGFSALQLSPDRDPLAPHAGPSPPDTVDLATLAERGWLRNLPPALLAAPPRIEAASPTERAVLGYLHGNCGHCHGAPGDLGASVPVGARLAQAAVGPGSADAVRNSLIGAPSRFRPASSSEPAQLVVPGRSDASVLVLRMRSRDPRVQMPPLGTALPDTQALALVERWINHELPTQGETRP